MGFFSFYNLQKLWSVWELRSIILFSLFLQVFLVFASPLRKKTANPIITIPIWLAYLLADWAAVFAVGIIAHNQGDASIDKGAGDLAAFWAPFLINHLGGPDTITAFALEDNELWLRHLLQLGSQLAAMGYIFYKLLPDSELMVPTILMSVAGIIKYGERTYSLYLASVKTFRNSLWEEYGVQAYSWFKGGEDTMYSRRPNLLEGLDMVGCAYHWFQRFKGLVVDFIYIIEELCESQIYFSNRKAEEAFNLVELELNFMYEVLYTKMAVIRCRVGYFIRLVCFVLVFVSFWLWYSTDKSHYHRYDVQITYTLLGGAIVLDVNAFFMLIYSVWRISPSKYKSPIKNWLAISIPSWSDYTEEDKSKLSKLLSRVFCRRPSSENENRKTIPLRVLATRIFQRRWSENIQQFNLLDYCVNGRNQNVEKLYKQLGLKDLADEIQYVSVRWFTPSLRDSIFSQLKTPSLRDSIFSQLKEKYLKGYPQSRKEWLRQYLTDQFQVTNRLLSLIIEVDFEESLVTCHIATELCYNCYIDADVTTNDESRKISKTLSDYMVYLLLRHPNMMTPIGGAFQFMFIDTIIDAKRYFEELNFDPKEVKEECRVRTACTKLLEIEVSTHRGKSVLILAIRLAKTLKDRRDKWEVLRTIWIDMITYAAIQCSGNAHAAQLSKGGQLITVVWLLMVHLGMPKQYTSIGPELCEEIGTRV